MTTIFTLYLVLSLSPVASAVNGEAHLNRYDLLLERYVEGDRVRYDAWRENEEDHAALSGIAAALEATDPASLDEPSRQALYINLYNAKTLQLVLDGNPKESIRELSKARFGFGIFFKEIVDFDGKTISLNALEKRLREESGDPRVHFAVHCASHSCPGLLDEAFRGERLDEQLEHQSFAYLERADAMLIEERPGGPPVVRLSKIFDWYAKDFGGASGVREFVRRYAPVERRDALAGGFRIAYLDYDWSLNRVVD